MRAALVAIALIAAGCGGDNEAASEDAITFVGADGVESVIEDSSRIISLNGDLTEIIYALGADDLLVGVDVTTDYPPEADDLPRVGIGQLLFSEPVLDLDPTLVIGDEQIGPETALDQIRDAGVPVVILPLRRDLDEMDDKVRDVASVLGIDGEEVAAQVQAEIDKAAAAARPLALRAAFIYVAGGGRTVLLFGAQTPMSSMLERAGVTDAGADSGLVGAVPLTPEAVVAAAPDVIVTSERSITGSGGMDGFLEIPGVGDTPAAQADQILVYPDSYILGFGPRVADALAELIEDLAALAG